MKRRWQYFEAPGDADEDLPGDASPWNLDRLVMIPLFDWNSIREFAESLDAVDGALLWTHSGRSGLPTVIDCDADELGRMVRFLGRVVAELETAAPVVPHVTEDQPEAYPNAELARMTRNVQAVMVEALNLGEPFRAWYE